MYVVRTQFVVFLIIRLLVLAQWGFRAIQPLNKGVLGCQVVVEVFKIVLIDTSAYRGNVKLSAKSMVVVQEVNVVVKEFVRKFATVTVTVYPANYVLTALVKLVALQMLAAIPTKFALTTSAGSYQIK